ncbi:MAG TPA: DUF1573 domain-containing protein [Candidatus Acetothermia bacterium]|nr:DUF1573 domain-containing protein [Candidatus Acetothermia bacterium]
MRKIGFIGLLLVLGLGLVVSAAPKISVGAPVYNFGAVIEGIAVVHTFVLKNVGDEPLTIGDVQVSCGCTTTSLSKSTLAPGESVDLAVTFDSAGFSGEMTKNIYVESNDPTTPKFILQLVGTVNRPQAYNIAVSDLNYLFYLLIDLRTPEEYATSHFLGAINIPYEKLVDWTPRLPKGVLIILYDEDGTLSDQAAQTLNETGFPEAKSLLGGLNEWVRQFKDKFIQYKTAE